MIVLLYQACVQDAPVPYVGACADYPDGVYEYGEIGIGTCLAGPSDLRMLSDGHTVALTNANPWLNFSGGSLWTLDLDALDLGAGRNLVSELGSAVGAMDLPNFAGSLAYVEEQELLLVANRLSEDARTREADDEVWFVDVSDPASPAGATIGEDASETLAVGYDPNGLLYDPVDDYAYVIDRTSHTVAVMDLGASPVALVDPGGDGSVEGDDFVDADGSGSTADWVTIEAYESESITPHAWSLSWSPGSLRLWLPNDAGAYRVETTGNGVWTRSALEADLDLSQSDGLVESLGDPDFLTIDSSSLCAFVEDGSIWLAESTDDQVDWGFGAAAVLDPDSASWDAVIGGPSMVVDADGLTWLFYDGGDGATQSIGAALTSDFDSFSRYGAAPLLSIDGASLEDPYVLWDPGTAWWRMFYTQTRDGVSSIGQAVSTDLVDWTVLDFEAEGVAPVAGWFNEELLLFSLQRTTEGGPWTVRVARAPDAWTFGEAEPLFFTETVADEPPGLGLQAAQDENFSLRDEDGDVFETTLGPGDDLSTSDHGFSLSVAVGFWSGPDDAGDAGAGGLQLDSVVGDVVWASATDAEGQLSVLRGSWDGESLAWEQEPVLEAGAGGDFDADGVHAPVVWETDGGWVMLYAGVEGAVTSIGRATSTDGVSWTAAAEPVLSAVDTWESVAMEPGSVQVLDDGSLRLWYSGHDGSEWRIGVAESTDEGQTWTRVAGLSYAWSFDSGSPGDWDDSGVRHPFVIREGETDHLWYAGYDGASWQIGHATREGDDGEWEGATDGDGAARAVLAAGGGSFGAAALQRPVVSAGEEGWELFYTGVDEEVGRVGWASGPEADRLHRVLRMPTVGDSWGFTSIPEDETGAIDLDQAVDGEAITARGCTALTKDDNRGFVYVGCTLVPLVFVLDVRDDSTDTDADLNYLDVEAVLFAQTTTNSDSGFRDLLYDPTRDVLWALSDDPEGVYRLRVDDLVDDDGNAFVRDRILGTLALPRADERDRGVDTQASVGPGSMVLHPDGRHLFVTNFNHNSVTAFDLDLGPDGMEVGAAEDVGENPYGIVLTPDGSRGVVGNYSGEVVDDVTTNSTLAILDTDPDSASFMSVLTWVVNQ